MERRRSRQGAAFTAALVTALLTGATASDAALKWDADYEKLPGTDVTLGLFDADDGVLLETPREDWTGHHVANRCKPPEGTLADCVELQSRTNRKGSFAGQFKLEGIHGSDTGDQRAEVTAAPTHNYGLDGQTVWYGWSTKFGSSTKPFVPGSANYFTQWHEKGTPAGPTCGPPVAMVLNDDSVNSPGGESFKLRVEGGTKQFTINGQGQPVWAACGVGHRDDHHKIPLVDPDDPTDETPLPYTTTAWYDFQLQIRWTFKSRKDMADPSSTDVAYWESQGVGFLELWVNGEQIDLAEDGTDLDPDGETMRLYSATLLDEPADPLDPEAGSVFFDEVPSKQGLYWPGTRPTIETGYSHIFHDAMRAGDTRADVTP